MEIFLLAPHAFQRHCYLSSFGVIRLISSYSGIVKPRHACPKVHLRNFLWNANKLLVIISLWEKINFFFVRSTLVLCNIHRRKKIITIFWINCRIMKFDIYELQFCLTCIDLKKFKDLFWMNCRIQKLSIYGCKAIYLLHNSKFMFSN